ncbi:MAG: hypothetical protein JSW65_03145, partial [Candidatus Bipolaricaulota bacterium]
CWTVEGARGSFDDPTQLRPVYRAPEACGPFEEVELTLTVTNRFGVTAVDSLTVLVCDDTCDLPPFSTRIAYPTASGVTTVLPPGMECPWPPVLPVPPEPEDCPPAPVPDCEPPALPDDCAPPVEPGLECEPPEPPAECPPVVPPVVECEPVPEECAPPPNCPPTADAGGDITAPQCTRVLLTCDADDPDGDALTYLWTVDCGQGAFDDPTLLHPTFVTPVVPCGGEERITLTLTVTDSHGATARDSMIVHVTNPNRPPTADAGEDIAVEECTRVQLTCDASDPDGDALSYFWTVACGRGRFEDPRLLHPVYVAPDVTCGGVEEIELTLTVTDRCGATASDTMTVRVSDHNGRPRAELGDDLIVLSGSSFKLMPEVSDPDGDILHFAWSVSAGGGTVERPTDRTPAYHAPVIPAGTERIVEITVTASDPHGAEASDTLLVRVRNPEPVATP